MNKLVLQANGSEQLLHQLAIQLFLGVGTDNKLNKMEMELILHMFCRKKVFQSFGKYTGNGNADGTFVYTGFKPAFLIQKDK